MMNRLMPSTASERVAISWVVAGLALLMLVGLSFSMGEPEAAAPNIPTYAIDEELAPLQSGALEADIPNSEFV